jgi:hypothetical protein
MDDLEKLYRKGMGKAADDVIQSEYAYWSALLTFNGIVIAVFSVVSILSVQQSHWFFFVLVLTSMVASLLIILNFYARKKWLLKSGLRIIADDPLSPIVSDADKIRERIRFREPLILILLCIEAVMMLWLMLPKFCQ